MNPSKKTTTIRTTHNLLLNASSISTITFLSIFIITVQFISNSHGHGRLIEPPSRSSAWRYGFQTPPNYNDHELYCGGFQRQQRNGGKCGECGDAWDTPQPRPNEYGGKWGQGVVVRKYSRGSDITIRVELTASHMGYFEFRVCDHIDAKQDCLDKHLLELLSGTPSIHADNDLTTRFYPRNGSRIYEIKGQLPSDLECGNCVLQWRYIAGNNWGMCPDGTGAVGCGAQEEFRACADISIGELEPLKPLRPTRPGTIKPSKPATKTPETSTDTSNEDAQDQPTGPRYLGAIIAILSLLLVICVLISIYLYNYHGQRIKHLLHWKQAPVKNNQQQQKTISGESRQNVEQNSNVSIPVPPPRTKRLLSQSAQEIGPNESSVLNGETFS